VLGLATGGCAGGETRAQEEWPAATLEEQGLDPTAAAGYVRRIRAGRYGDIHSLLVVRNGKLVLERYFGGWDRDTPHPVYSVTKSVTSLLVGQARDEGRFPSLERTLVSVFPEYQEIRRPDARKRSITLDDVLTMRAGFAWDELSSPYDSPDNPIGTLMRSEDWLQFVLDLPMASTPGSRFVYNSGCSLLLGGLLRKSTGLEPEEFASRRLFKQLGITDYEWEAAPHGLTNTGWGLSLRPRDLAKLGQLVLDGGEWQGEQVVPTEWLDLSTASHVRLSDEVGYGYQWWLLFDQGGRHDDVDLVIALGWGGQLVIVAPALNLVVASTAADYASQREGVLKVIRPFLSDVVVTNR
jgi:CubicO group peptidase (beta-lactamase class C family)